MYKNISISDLAFRNRVLLSASVRVFCYFCNRTFFSKQIKQWTDSGQTALCCNCGVDSVVPTVLSVSAVKRFGHQQFNREGTGDVVKVIQPEFDLNEALHNFSLQIK